MTNCKEDEDFVILPQTMWDYLFGIYGGIDVERKSIEISTDTDQKEYMVEVFYKKLLIYILPKTRNHVSLKKPSGVYISRKATIKDFRRKVAEILFDSQKDKDTVEDLMGVARVWRLDTGENICDVEKYFESETDGRTLTKPLPIRGRILKDEEIIDDINVADTDVLLYEVFAFSYLKNNNFFAFIPSKDVEKNRKSKNSFLKDLN